MFSPELRSQAQALIDRYPVGRSALLPLLHLLQSQDGYVSDDGVAEIAQLLALTKAEVAAVATFYTMYKRAPLGEHLVSVCTNFACKVRGGQEVYDRLKAKLGVGHNETTGDGRFTLEHAECLGNCEGAPVVTVDYLNYECLSPEAAEELVDRIAAGEIPPPTRGPIPPGVRAVSVRLAGLAPAESGMTSTVGEDRGEQIRRTESFAGPNVRGEAVKAAREREAAEAGLPQEELVEEGGQHDIEMPTDAREAVGTPEDRVEADPEARPHVDPGEEPTHG